MFTEIHYSIFNLESLLTGLKRCENLQNDFKNTFVYINFFRFFFLQMKTINLKTLVIVTFDEMNQVSYKSPFFGS
jgi:hypothetical protein